MRGVVTDTLDRLDPGQKHLRAAQSIFPGNSLLVRMLKPAEKETELIELPHLDGSPDWQRLAIFTDKMLREILIRPIQLVLIRLEPLLMVGLSIDIGLGEASPK